MTPQEAFAAIEAERQRQISVEGWTPEHDDGHSDGEMLLAAVLYARFALGDQLTFREDGAPLGWPWEREAWKPKERERTLTIAGALCMAERDRIWRATSPSSRRALPRNQWAYWPPHVKHKFDLIVYALAEPDELRPRRQTVLLPCPFCGSHPEIFEDDHLIECHGINCIGPKTTAAHLEDAIVQWNTRAAPIKTGDCA